MHLTLLAITGALFFIASSNALSVDSFHHLARHQHIAARHPAVKRASVSARCKKRNSTSTTAPSSTLHPTYAPPASSSSHAPPSSSSQAPPSSPSSGSGKGKVGIAWAYHDGDDAKLKNFITNKVSTFVDFFLFSSSFPYLFSPAYTLGALKSHKTLMDCNLLQCYGVPNKSVTSRALSTTVMQNML